MLDYAANGVKYWPVAELRTDFENEALLRNQDPAGLLASHAPDREPDEFWDQVERNLRSGHVRMVFVADHIPDELVRIIEFLNEQMSPAEVLGVEVQQYTDGAVRVLVPRVVGATATAKATKERTTGTSWNAATFLAAAAERCSDREVRMLERLFAHAESRGTRLSWGKGVTPGVSGWYPVAGPGRGVWTANAGSGGPDSNAYIYIWLPEIRSLLSENACNHFLSELGKIDAWRSELDSGRRKYPSVNLRHMSDDDLEQFLRAVELLPQTAFEE